MKKIAILMTVFNRKDTTLRSLKQISEQQIDKTNYSIDIYLTDDKCTDGTPEAVKKLFPDVKIVSGDGTLFWNRGMYKAWEVAEVGNYDYYLWLNDDTYLYNDAIKCLLLRSEQYDNKAIIVGSTCAVGKQDIITYGGWRRNEFPIKNVERPENCESFNGNIVLIPRIVFAAVGKNDPYYRHNLGDADYGLTARRRGFEIYTSGCILGECDAHDSLPVWCDPQKPFAVRKRNFYSPTGLNPFEFFYFKKKNYGLMSACRSFITNYIRLYFPNIWTRQLT